MAESIGAPRRESDRLPPRELWLHNPFEDEPLPTPVDERGLVDVPGLIELVKSTVDPSYDWASPGNNVHHLHWPHAYYRQYDNRGNLKMLPLRFRNQASEKIVIPIIPHNWLHRVTSPPEVPSMDVMQYRFEAQHVALALFSQVRNSKRVARRYNLGRKGLEDLLMERYDSFEARFTQGQSLPAEFQPINFSAYELNNFDDMLTIANKLGKFTVMQSAVGKLVRYPIAA